MIKNLANNALKKFAERYDYAVDYLQYLLQKDGWAFLKFSFMQGISNHRRSVPMAPYYAAKICTTMWEDCGPCVQLVVNMALEAKVQPQFVRAIVDKNLEQLPEEIILVMRFTEAVLARSAEVSDLREEVCSIWGDAGLVTLGLAIATSRVYPTLKYSLGFAKSCSRVEVDGMSIVPGSTLSVALPL